MQTHLHHLRTSTARRLAPLRSLLPGAKASDIGDPTLRVLTGLFAALGLLFVLGAQTQRVNLTVVELAQPTQQVADGELGNATFLLGEGVQSTEIAREPRSAVAGQSSPGNHLCLHGEEFCYETETVDMLDRRGIGAIASFEEDIVVYASDFGGTVAEQFRPLTGDWAVVDGVFRQVDDCGYDLIALLEAQPMSDFRLESSFRSLGDVNNGGLVIHQSDANTRSGAAVVDLAEDGRVIRWGHYDANGYYVYQGSQPVDPVLAGEMVTLTLDVRGTTTVISFNGRSVATIETPYGSGMVGLITTTSAIGFDRVELTALAPAPSASTRAFTGGATASRAVGG